MFGELLTEMDLTPDDLGPLRTDLVRGEHARASLALLGQQRIAEAESKIERAHVEGLGELQMRVDGGVYFRMALLHGIDCWRDEGFRRHMLKANPMMRIRSRSRKTTLRVQGLRDASRVESRESIGASSVERRASSGLSSSSLDPRPSTSLVLP